MTSNSSILPEFINAHNPSIPIRKRHGNRVSNPTKQVMSCKAKQEATNKKPTRIPSHPDQWGYSSFPKNFAVPDDVCHPNFCNKKEKVQTGRFIIQKSQ